MTDKESDYFTEDFTIEGFFRYPDLSKLAPNDGKMHHVAVTRTNKKVTTHGAEYIDGVLFHTVKTYGEDGRLETAQYTRADLVRG